MHTCTAHPRDTNTLPITNAAEPSVPATACHHRGRIICTASRPLPIGLPTLCAANQRCTTN
eukprot:364870-Chlamydomonas_euryale.AAC.7